MKQYRSLLPLIFLLIGTVLLGSCSREPMPPVTDTASDEKAPTETSDGTVTEAPTEEAATDSADTEPALLEIIKAGQKRAT